MEKKITILKRFSSFKIVLIYAAVSIIYIFLSDYILELFFNDFVLISKWQTLKGIIFIIVTSTLLHVLMKININKLSNYYRQIIDFKLVSEEQSKQSKQEYIALFNHSPLPMWIFDLETLRFLNVNEAACEHYGFSYEEFMAMTIREIRPEAEIPQMEALLTRAIQTSDASFLGLMKHRKKNGDVIQVKLKTSQVNFDRRIGILVSAVDITPEICIQNKLLAVNTRLQQACEIATMGYWTNDLKTGEIIWSVEMHKIFETNPDTFLLTMDNVKNRFHPEERQKLNTATFSNFELDAIIESEQRIITDSGKIKWILERIHLIRDESNIPIRLEGIAVDITKRKLHEQEIFESNERFKILAKATVEAIIDWDHINDTIFFGEGFNTMFGYEAGMADKNLWLKNIHSDDSERVIKDLKKAIKNSKKEFFNAEYRFIKANGDIAYIQHKGIFIRNNNGDVTRIISAMVDLTESLEKMNTIEQQNKTLKDISWTQSHVVRAPLANLLGLINLMKDNKKMGYTDDRLIDYIGESATKLDHIIHDIVKKSTQNGVY
ncbi:PAS domain-containing protein [Flavobacterium sp.]|jgi:PAS domain S-box-containing protein|uniref:PAS domain-containing protein n=1 Tax=Flavobacterium sp. TaxID=239 RepID=UPI0037839D6A